jgi:AcrR family transcriptional regulator
VKKETNSNAAAIVTARREDILAVAADLFWAKGYHATPMSELAAALGLQKGSIYHHVRSKEALLYDLSVGCMLHAIDGVESVTAAEPLSRLRAIIERHIGALLAEQSRNATALAELHALSPQERAHVIELRDRYERTIDEAIRAVQEQHDLWPGIQPKLVRLALLGMLNWSVFWYTDNGALSPREIADAFVSIFVPEAVTDSQSQPTPGTPSAPGRHRRGRWPSAGGRTWFKRG